MSSRPRILYLAPNAPNGPCFGTQLRVRQIASALKDVGELSLVVAGLQEELSGATTPGGEFAVDRFLVLAETPAGSFADRFQRSLNVRATPYGHRADETSKSWVHSYLPQFDMVWLHNMRTAYAFDRWIWPRSVMDLDDIPSTFYQSVSDNGETLTRRLKSQVRVRLHRRRERLLSQRFTVVTVCSESDRDYLRLAGPVHVIPNGFDMPKHPPVRTPANPPRIGFIGTFNYPPNVESIRWFIQKCWPQIRQRVPNVRLRLVGSQTDGNFKPTGPDIDALGYMESTADEIATWSAMIVPIRQGAGTRLKIADGFSKKVPMIATSLGVSGYAVTNGVEMLIADSPEDFAAACVETIMDPAKAEQMADRGWNRFLKEWSWEAIRPRIWAAAEDCLRRSGSREAGRTLVAP